MIDSPVDQTAITIYPSTSTNAILCVSATLQVLFKEFITNSKIIGSSFLGGLNSLEERRKLGFQKHFVTLTSALCTQSNLEPVLLGLTKPNLDLSSKFNRAMAEKIGAKSTSSLFFKSSMSSALKEIVKKRESLKANREGLIASSQINIKNINQSRAKVLDVILDRNTMLLGLFKFLADTYIEFFTSFHRNAQIITESVDSIEFKGDFSSYIRNNKIIRYDFRNRPFEFVNTDSVAFEGIEKPTLTYFPNAFPMALALSNISPEGPNEIPFKKGRHIYLLEDPTMDWVHIMDPISKEIGFVPSSHVRKIGNALAVAINDPDPGEIQGISIKCGDLFSVIEVNKSKQNMVIHTIHGDVGIISINATELVYGKA